MKNKLREDVIIKKVADGLLLITEVDFNVLTKDAYVNGWKACLRIQNAEKMISESNYKMLLSFLEEYENS